MTGAISRSLTAAAPGGRDSPALRSRGANLRRGRLLPVTTETLAEVAKESLHPDPPAAIRDAAG